MHLLYESKYFKIKQCDFKRCFVFETENKQVRMTCFQLLALRNKVNSIDLESHFDDEQNRSGLEILVFCNREHLMILNTYQVIDLKTFMATAFAILERHALPAASV